MQYSGSGPPGDFIGREWIDRSDDSILALLAITVSGWYLSGKNRFQRSFVPFGLLIVALATKITGLALEIGDPDAAGDEFGVIPVLLLILILSGYILYSTGIPQDNRSIIT